jgi:alkylation response protein AidB-like acyl-CoA dehydrogenase
MNKPTTPQVIESMAAHLMELLPHHDTWHAVALRAHRELAGWSGLDLPARHGGAAWCATDMARLFCLCGRRDAELRDLVGAGHARLLALVPTRRFDAVLSAVARSAAYCAAAITEPDVGSDLRALMTTPSPVDGGYVLDGTKQHISRIGECTHFVVFAAVRRPTKNPLITTFLIPRDSPGLEIEPMRPSGLGAALWGRVFLRHVNVPLASRIGGEGQGLSLFKRSLLLLAYHDGRAGRRQRSGGYRSDGRLDEEPTRLRRTYRQVFAPAAGNGALDRSPENGLAAC